MFLEKLLEFGAEGLQYTKGITLSMPADKLGEPTPDYDWNDDGLELNLNGDWAETRDELGQKHHQPRMLNTFMRLLICKVPIGQLETFRWVSNPSTIVRKMAKTHWRWYHNTKISRMTIELVARRHGRSLKTLQIYNNPDDSFDCKLDSSALTNFDAGDLHSHDNVDWAITVVGSSNTSINHVKLGCERELALTYLGLQAAFDGRFWGTVIRQGFGDSLLVGPPHSVKRNDWCEAAAKIVV